MKAVIPHTPKSPQFLSLSSSLDNSRERELQIVSMAFLSLVGRVFFVSVFVLSAWQEFNDFGVDGGSAAKALTPKFNVFSNLFTTHTGFQVPTFEIKLLIAGAIALKVLGSFLFIFGSNLGATLLILHQLIATPILYDFYNYDTEKNEFHQLFIKFAQSLALLGALLFFIGMKNCTPRRSSTTKKSSKTKTT